MVVLSIEQSVSFPAIDRSTRDFPEEPAGPEENTGLNAELEKEKDILKTIVDALNKKFSIEKPKQAKPKKSKKEDDISSLVDNERFTGTQQKTYSLMEEFFSYLGKLRTTTNIYKEHLVDYAEKKKEEEPLPQKAKTQDMDYNEFEEMIRVKKINDMMSGGKSGGLNGSNTGFESLGASTEEKWKFLRLFGHYRVLAMLRYQMSMT